MSVDVAAIRARLAAATPGPWEWRKYGLYGIADDKRAECVINEAVVSEWEISHPAATDGAA